MCTRRCQLDLAMCCLVSRAMPDMALPARTARTCSNSHEQKYYAVSLDNGDRQLRFGAIGLFNRMASVGSYRC